MLSGHEHNYERSFPVRGHDPPSGTVTTAFGHYAVGDTIDTRRPSVVTTTPATVNGTSAWNTARGTVYLVLGGGGAASTLPYGVDPANGLPQALVWVTLNGRNAAEDAPWSAGRDPGDAHGFAIFDVDAGHRPGDTTITMKYFQIPTVPNGGTTALPTTPFETHIFGRKVPVVHSGQLGPPGARSRPCSRSGDVGRRPSSIESGAAGGWPEGVWPEGVWPEGVWPEGVWPEGVWPEGVWPEGVWPKGVWARLSR